MPESGSINLSDQKKAKIEWKHKPGKKEEKEKKIEQRGNVGECLSGKPMKRQHNPYPIRI